MILYMLRSNSRLGYAYEALKMILYIVEIYLELRFILILGEIIL
jgi:hypothetical protein